MTLTDAQFDQLIDMKPNEVWGGRSATMQALERRGLVKLRYQKMVDGVSRPVGWELTPLGADRRTELLLALQREREHD